MAASLITTGLSLGLTGAEYGHARHQELAMKKELARLKRPFMKIQDEYFQDRNIAAEQAMSGMPAATKDFLAKERRQGLSTGIAGLLESGVKPGDVGKLFQTYDDAISADAAKDAELRTRNIDYFININKDLAGQKTNQFVVNELAPYESKLKQLTQNIAIEKANENASITAAASTLSSAGNVMGGMGGGGGSKGGGATNAGITASMFSNSDSSGFTAPNSVYGAGTRTDSSGGGGLTQAQLNDILSAIQEAYKSKE